MNLKDSLLEWVRGVGVEPAAKCLGTYPSIVKRWLDGTHKPSIEHISTFVEKEHLLKAKEPEPVTDGSVIVTIDVIRRMFDSEPDKMRELCRQVYFPWEGKGVFVGFPCYKMTNAATSWCLTILARQLHDKIGMDMVLGDAMIYHARNRLAMEFMKRGSDWLLFIDDDMVVPVGRADWFKDVGRLPRDFPDRIAGTHVIERLLKHNKTVIGGCYFGRHKYGFPLAGVDGVAYGNYQRLNQAARTMEDTILPVDWVATGCLMIHRKVFEDIMNKFPELAPSGDRKEWDFFKPMEIGEDVAFCRRAKAAGHQVYVDTGCQCLHIGYMAYGAHNTMHPSNSL